MSHPAPTLHDVAKAAGVSTATVSRCLNAPDRVIEPTRARVLEVVRALGYTPHFGAKVMASNRTHTIGAVIPTMENAIFARGLQAFQEELRQRGYTLLVASSSYRPDVEAEQIRTLVTRGADGLLLIGQNRGSVVHDFLAARGIPALAAWTYDTDAPLVSVGFDNRKAMRALADSVLQMGHRHIGVISASTVANDRARLRIGGIEDAAAAFGIVGDALPVVETEYSIESGALAFAQLMGRATRPTAVMCGNDVLAAGAIKQARAMDLDVPGDVSITGFDDIELATVVNPALTTVHVPHREMGRAAAKRLIEMVEGQPGRAPIELATAICMRDSLAPPL